MPVRERPALGVLPREADRDPVLEQRRERERLGLAPVDSARLDGLAAPLELAGELGVHREAGWHPEQLLVQRAQAIDGNGRLDDVGSPGRGDRLRWRRRRLGDRRPQPVVGRAQRRRHLADDRLDLVFTDDAFLDEPRGVLLADRRLVVDPLDHERLRVGRLVLLVVAEAAVADDVDHEVVAELRPVGEGEPHRAQRRLGVVGVDVDDRDVEALREVARVARGAALGRVGREADLVVRDQVQRAPRRVALEALQVERLGHDSLPREGRVAVDQDGQRDGRVVQPGALRAVGLLGACPPLDDRVDRLEVARVRRDRHLDLAGGGHPRAGGREVVLDVAAAALRVDDERVVGALSLELPQDRLVGASDGVDERVRAARGAPSR